MKQQKRIYICRLLTVAWMVVIFCFSAQPSEASSETSSAVGEIICSALVPDYRNLPEETRQAYAARIDHPVRKCAHATEYAVLGILLFLALEKMRHPRSRFLWSWGIGAAYAATDEFHQLFVSGRSCQLTDVCIDAAGCLIGVLLVKVIVERLIPRYHIPANPYNPEL
jgi:VanZ family protein